MHNCDNVQKDGKREQDMSASHLVHVHGISPFPKWPLPAGRGSA
jgi:hypothetical protein